jgi:hypothetical protein
MSASRVRLGAVILFAVMFSWLFVPAYAGDGPGPSAQDRPPATKPDKPRRVARYEIREKHDRDGIGKFYMGREIAHVMGYQGIDWLERPERETEEHLTQLVDVLKLTPGMVVADIGAGSGVI